MIHRDKHYSDVIMSAMAYQITGVSIVCSAVCSTSNLRVTGLCEANSPVTGEFPAQREMFLFGDVIMKDVMDP